MSAEDLMLTKSITMAVSLLEKELDTSSAKEIGITAAMNAKDISYSAPEGAEQPEINKAGLKNAFNLIQQIYKELLKKYETEKADAVISNVIVSVAQGFFANFKPIGDGEGLLEYAEVYKGFENNNLVYDIVQETPEKIEYNVNRCLIKEAMDDLDMGHLTTNLCGFAHLYFMRYHPNIYYLKDRSIARGDATCHEVFEWRDY
jgi:hypothetical protein